MEARDIVLVVEDLHEAAGWQIAAMDQVLPELRVMHALSLEEAHDVLRDGSETVKAVLTDNGFPLFPGGERLGSKSMEGGAGTLLVKQIRHNELGEHYQELPVAWHTADLDEDKIERVMSYGGPSRCFAKGQGAESYLPMGEYLKSLI